MSISQALSNATSGLTASARLAQVTSANVSNAQTPGYARRSVELSAQTVGGSGRGVQVDGIIRITDRGLLADRRLADAQLGGDQMTAGAAAAMEALIGAPGDASGIGGRIAALESALFAAANQPASEQSLSNVVRSLGDLATTLNEDAEGLRAERQSADAAIATQVYTLNTQLARIEDLNQAVAQATTSGNDATAVQDLRQQAVDEISQIVPLRETDRQHGQIALYTTSGEMLIDGPAAKFEFTPTNTIMPHMTLSGGMLGGITRDGVSLGADGFGGLKGGSLEAAFVLRDATVPAAEAELDAIARNLIERFQDPFVDPSLGAADAGLLTDNGVAYAGPGQSGLAGRIAVNAAIDPAAGGALSRLRDGVAAGATGPVSDAAQLNRFIDALNVRQTLATGGSAENASGLADRFASGLGADRIAAEDAQTFATARWSALRETELAGGVDTDHEMQMLLKIEQAYAANARVIQTVEAMIQRLMEI